MKKEMIGFVMIVLFFFVFLFSLFFPFYFSYIYFSFIAIEKFNRIEASSISFYYISSFKRSSAHITCLIISFMINYFMVRILNSITFLYVPTQFGFILFLCSFC